MPLTSDKAAYTICFGYRSSPYTFLLLQVIFLTGMSFGDIGLSWAHELSSEYVSAGDAANEAGRITEAEMLYHKAIASVEQQNSLDPKVADVYSKLGRIYRTQKEYAKEKNAYKRAVYILEWCFGPESLEVIPALNQLASAYYHLDGEQPLSIALYRQVLVIRENLLGPNHPDVAESLDTLGLALDFPFARLPQSLPLFERALAIREKAFGPDDLAVAVSLNTLAFVYDLHGHYDKAEPYYLRALSIRNKKLGSDAPEVIQTLYNLGVLYSLTRQYDKAEALEKRRVASLERTLGSDHRDFASALQSYASLLFHMGREEEASKIQARADQIMKIQR